MGAPAAFLDLSDAPVVPSAAPGTPFVYVVREPWILDNRYFACSQQHNSRRCLASITKSLAVLSSGLVLKARTAQSVHLHSSEQDWKETSYAFAMQDNVPWTQGSDVSYAAGCRRNTYNLRSKAPGRSRTTYTNGTPASADAADGTTGASERSRNAAGAPIWFKVLCLALRRRSWSLSSPSVLSVVCILSRRVAPRWPIAK